jgi:transposase-like protein
MVMTVKNKYVKSVHISERKFHKLARRFSIDLNASQIANLAGLSRNTVNRYLHVSGEVEDESFFGARCIKGKRVRGAYGKTIAFGIFKRNGSVYTEIVSNCSNTTLQKAIRGKVSLDSIIYSDGWRGYNGLVDFGYGKNLRVDHGKDEFARDKAHINAIKGFCGFTRTRLIKYRAMHPRSFSLPLKECEFRFNYRDHDIYRLLLEIFRNQPLKLS